MEFRISQITLKCAGEDGRGANKCRIRRTSDKIYRFSGSNLPEPDFRPVRALVARLPGNDNLRGGPENGRSGALESELSRVSSSERLSHHHLNLDAKLAVVLFVHWLQSVRNSEASDLLSHIQAVDNCSVEMIAEPDP
jgi:hypothetical protein